MCRVSTDIFQPMQGNRTCLSRDVNTNTRERLKINNKIDLTLLFLQAFHAANEWRKKLIIKYKNNPT